MFSPMRFCYSMTANQCYRIPQLATQEHVGFEIRLDSFEKEPDFKALRALTDRPLLGTFRSRPHLGMGSVRARNTKGWAWREWAMEAGFELIDLELDEPGLPARIEQIRKNGCKVVLSHHELGDNAGLEPAFDKALETDADIIKIIGSGWSSGDMLLQRQHYERAIGRRFVHFYMGAEFTATRVLSLIYGAPFTFITPLPGEAVAPGQLTLQDVEEIYQIDRIDVKKLKLFAVLGLPVGHSRSPEFHNPRLRKVDPNSLFIPLPAASRDDYLSLHDAFPELCGCAVTKPMKEIAHHVANRYLDPDSEELGAVNTLLFENDVAGTNTDLLAMIDLIGGLKDKGPVRILGYGGLGRAVVAACAALKIPAEVCNRTPGRIKDLPPRVLELPWSERHREGPSIFVQATSAGMSPHTAISPMETIPRSARFLIETIYNPDETRLMKMAREQGVQVIEGMALFEAQARIQNQFFIKRLQQDFN